MFNSKNYFRIFLVSLFGFLFLGMSACSSDNDSPPPAQASVQVIHASPDAPAVNILTNGNNLVQDFDYSNVTEKVNLEAGTLNVDVQALLPDMTTPSVIGPVDLQLAADTNTLVIAANSVANIEPLVIVRDDATIASGNTRVRIIHAAPAAPQVDIYVTAPGADLANSSALTTAAFKDSTGELDVAAGQYQIRITPAGSQTVVFDSGEISLIDGADLAILAIENTATANSPVQLLVVDENGGTSIRDINTTADIRVTHASPDAPAVDVIVNEDFTAPLVANLAYSETAGFVQVPADGYFVQVVPTGAETPVVIDFEASLEAAANYSVYAVGELADIAPLVLVRDRRRVATEAKIDIIHASPAAGNVDIYVTAPGASIDNATPNFSDIAFQASTDFVSLPAGNYEVTVTPTGTKTAAIGPATIALEAGGIYTVAARDNQRTAADPDGLPLGLILLDDFLVQ